MIFNYTEYKMRIWLCLFWTGMIGTIFICVIFDLHLYHFFRFECFVWYHTAITSGFIDKFCCIFIIVLMCDNKVNWKKNIVGGHHFLRYLICIYIIFLDLNVSCDTTPLLLSDLLISFVIFLLLYWCVIIK